MNKTVSASSQELQYKAQAQSYLVEARRILRRLAADRQREERRRQVRRPASRPSILSEVKAILQRA
jgi:hypothetical protein